MAFPLARVSDHCTHGAVVITGSTDYTLGNMPLARLGDLVNCPKHGVNPIVSIQPIGTIDTKVRAHIQAMAHCGAIIVIGSPDSSAGI